MYDHLGAVQPPSGWFDSGCGAGPRVRWLAGGRLEVEGEGEPTRAVPKDVLAWSPLVAEKAKKYDLWPNVLAAFMATESGGQQKAKSYCCYGLMGLLPSTATGLAGRSVSPTELLNDPALNVDLGAKLVSQLLAKYEGNIVKATTAYNAGGAYCTPAKGCSSVNRWGMRSDCPNDVTVDYPGRVIGFSNALAGKVSGAPPSSTGRGSGSGLFVVVGLVVPLAALVLTSRRRAA